jgi:hypothetical protein
LVTSTRLERKIIDNTIGATSINNRGKGNLLNATIGDSAPLDQMIAENGTPPLNCFK